MAVEIASKNAVYAWLMQTNAATPGGASSTYEVIKFDSGSPQLDADVEYAQNDTTSTVGIMPTRDRSFSDYVSGMPKLNFTMPADLRNLAPLLYLALGTATEVTTTPFQKVITPYGETAVPDYSVASHAGVPPLWTLAGYKSDVSSDGFILENCLLNTLSFSIDFNSRGIGKLAKISGQFIGNELNYNVDLLSATFTAITSTWLNGNSDLFTLNITGIASLTGVCVKRYTLTINNNVTSDCKTTGGKANNYKINPEITAEVVIPYNAGTYTMVQGAITDSAESTFTLSKGSTGVTGYINIATKGRIVGNPNPADSGGYQDMTLQMRCEKPSSGSQCTVTIADAIDRNYPAP